jgi:EAL domain-containing protein (putative c-di-GMP-specific phosphodiesterase class I)
MSAKGPAKPAEEPNDRSAELEAIARRLLAGVSGMRVWSLSLHDEHGDVLWLNESVMGPDEHEAVRASLEIFAGEGAPTRHEHDMGDGRVAVTLSATLGSSVLGLLMVIVDRKAAVIEARTLSGAEGSPLHAPLEQFAQWLTADLSATQMRLRALPDIAAPEPDAAPKLELELALADELTATLEALSLEGAESELAPPMAPAPPGQPAPLTPLSLAPSTPRPPAAGAARPPAAAPGPKPAPAATAAGSALDRHYAALRAQPIVLYAQQLEPITAGSRIRRYEILLRTDSEHGRAKAPTAMIAAAAKHGLGSVVDRRVITDLVVWLARNPEVWRTDPISVSVNLSPSALVEPHFFKFLDLCMAKADLPRGMLAFELDTAHCAQNPQRTAEAAQLVAALGCTIILDDFGPHPEHMELLNLKGLRMLKLQPQLTSGVSTDKRQQAVVAGIAQMACVLGMHTCAKSIESREETRWLAALKIDFAQGYGFSKPAPLADLARR